MRKTSVYLTDDDMDGLRLLAEATGCSQAELIRAGIRTMLMKPSPREFRSMGLGQADAHDERRWNPDELAARRGVGP